MPSEPVLHNPTAIAYELSSLSQVVGAVEPSACAGVILIVIR